MAIVVALASTTSPAPNQTSPLAWPPTDRLWQACPIPAVTGG
jgi:hypothetical protein